MYASNAFVRVLFSNFSRHPCLQEFVGNHLWESRRRHLGREKLTVIEARSGRNIQPGFEIISQGASAAFDRCVYAASVREQSCHMQMWAGCLQPAVHLRRRNYATFIDAHTYLILGENKADMSRRSSLHARKDEIFK